ncbi:MAG: hypothetical protein GY784_16220 [Gammaproteobacteria bacterium]|nr:hypothetical protein [Gammaproteobacteria bacterium]
MVSDIRQRVRIAISGCMLLSSLLVHTVANDNGCFAMPNVPSFMGQIRARIYMGVCEIVS